MGYLLMKSLVQITLENADQHADYPSQQCLFFIVHMVGLCFFNKKEFLVRLHIPATNAFLATAVLEYPFWRCGGKFKITRR